MQFSVQTRTAPEDIEIEVEVPDTLSEADEGFVVAEVRLLGPRIWRLLHEVFLPALLEEADICIQEGSLSPVTARDNPRPHANLSEISASGVLPLPHRGSDAAAAAAEAADSGVDVASKQVAILRSHFGSRLLRPGQFDAQGDPEGQGSEVDERVMYEAVDTLLGCEVIGLFFGAQWSKRSCEFEALLKKAYASIRSLQPTQSGDSCKATKRLQVVYIGADHQIAQFEAARQNQPWLALPFKESAQKARLCHAFQVSDVPCLVLLRGSDCSRVTLDGVEAIEANCASPATGFPWRDFTHVPQVGRSRCVTCFDSHAHA